MPIPMTGLARQPIEVTSQQLVNLEAQLYKSIESQFISMLPKIKKDNWQYSNGKTEKVTSDATDDATVARLTVLMLDAAMEALYRSNRINLVQPPDPEVIQAELELQPA